MSIETQHYRITLSDAIAHYQSGDITAKGLLHFYLKIKLKPGWTLKKSQKEICAELGIGKTAFYSAISKLKAEGSINWSVPGTTQFSISLPVCECGNQSAIADNQFAIADNQFAIADNQFAIADKESPKPLSDKESSDPSYYYQIYFNSLSKSERENFLNFGREKASQLPKPPQLADKWIASNWEELRSLWLAQLSPAELPAASTERWASEERRDKWIAEIREGRPRWIAQGEQSLTRIERKAFAEWADANGLIWGAES